MGTAGFSLRASLEKQGVTTKEAMRKHLNLVYTTLTVNPLLRVDRYRVDPNYPNSGNPVAG